MPVVLQHRLEIVRAGRRDAVAEIDRVIPLERRAMHVGRISSESITWRSRMVMTLISSDYV